MGVFLKTQGLGHLGMSWYNELVEPNLTHLVITKSCFVPRVALRPGQRHNIWGTRGRKKGIPGDKKHCGLKGRWAVAESPRLPFGAGMRGL